MKILLVAYEFAPSASPQSLRWQYLCAEISSLGHEVRVFAPDLPEHHAEGLPNLPSAIEVRRTFAGPFHGLLRAKQRHQKRGSVASRASASLAMADGDGDASTGGGVDQGSHSVAHIAQTKPEGLNWKGVIWHAGLNWKGRVFQMLQECAAHVIYPDLRGEWLPWAKAGLSKELDSFKPDVVVTSHEPATTLQLGLHAKRLGYRWVADMGDPVLAPYTPLRWQRRALHLERAVCKWADLITVTADSVCSLMRERHCRERGMLVIPQGFDSRLASSSTAAESRKPGNPLELVYTGSFYKFRLPDDLIAAVVATPGVRLTIASINPPESVREASREYPHAIRLVGFLPHRKALRMQRDADVLVNIGNELPDQVPGKIYEYLGAGRPVLHLSSGLDVGTLAVLEHAARAVVSRNERYEISRILSKMVDCADIASDFGMDMSMRRVEEFSWEASARRFVSELQAR